MISLSLLVMGKINIKINRDFIIPVYQPYLFDYSHRYSVYWGGRGSGKTIFCIQKLVCKGLQEKRFILLMTKETNRVKITVWKDLLQVIDDMKLTKYFKFNKTDFTATCLLNGTEFKCLGLDNPEKAKGWSDVSDVLLDEATAFTKDDFDLIDGSIRSVKYKLPLSVTLSFNPVSKVSWVYKYWGFDTGIVPPDTVIIHSTYLDNPFLDQSFIKRMENMKARDYTRWKIEALGEFVSLDKLVYTNWVVEDFDYKTIKGQLLCGLDFGFVNDVSAFVSSLLVEDEKKIYVFREWGDTNKTNDELANIISSLGFSKSLIIADSAEQKSIEELRRAGIKRVQASKKGADSIIHGIQRIQQYDLVIHPSCNGVITELQNYSWQKDKATGEYINKPVDLWNHYLDALRYSIQIMDNQQKLQSISINGLGL